MKQERQKPFYCSDRLELDENERCITQCDHCRLLSTETNKQLKLEDIFNHEKRRGVRDLIDAHKQTDENGDPITYWGGLAEPKQETLEDIKLEEVLGSSYCKYTVIENKLAIIYRNQEKILSAIKLLSNEK